MPNKTSIQLVIIQYIWATMHSSVVSKLLSSISISIVCNPSTIGKSALYCYTIIAPFHHWKRNTKGQSMSFDPNFISILFIFYPEMKSGWNQNKIWIKWGESEFYPKCALYCYITIIAPFHHWKWILNTKGQSTSFYPNSTSSFIHFWSINEIMIEFG